VHRQSKEEIELHLLAGATMQQLEHFTSREAYSFPLCPRLHKCSIVANYCTGREVRVDLAVLVEKLTGNFANLACHPQRREMIKKLERQLEQLVQGLEYLYRRYGAFIVQEDQLSWNEYGMVRVWLSKNTLSNEAECPAESEKQMVASLVKVLENSLELSFEGKGSISCFQDLLQQIGREQYQRHWESSRRVKFESGRE
jgi:hypothetical protein